MADLNFIEWTLGDVCNYKCKYCCERKNIHKKGTVIADVQINSFFKFMESLKGKWEIHLAGKEPTLHPKFLGIIKKIKKTENLVSFYTNLSMPEDRLVEILNEAENKLVSLRASFHSGQANLEGFINKCKLVLKNKSEKTDFKAVTLFVPKMFKEMKYIANTFKQKGVPFYLEWFKTGRIYTGEYTDEQLEFLKEHTTDFLFRFAANNNFKGKMCWSGKKYLVTRINGSVLRCHAGGEMGNYKGVVTLYGTLKPCQFDRCPCPDPYERGYILVE